MNNLFGSLLGNENLKRLLTADVINHTVHHAYIIEGPEKCGKHLIAKSIINGLICTGDNANIPCGVCKNCKNLAEGNFADISYINRGENATISVDTVRQSLETLSYSPNEDSDYKFYIIEEADKMTPPAQNALLLSLEEPPEYVVFFILVNNSASLLETVRSRAITLKAELFSPLFVVEYLKSKPEFSGFDGQKLETAAALSHGSLGYAAMILKSGEQYAKLYNSVCDFVKNICGKNKSANILFFSAQKMSRQDCDDFLSLAMYAVRDLIAYKNSSQAFTFFVSADEVSRLTSSITVAKLVRAQELITKARDDIVLNNANINLVLTHLAASAV